MIANWNEFFTAVERMRIHQKEYFRTKSEFELVMAKHEEQLVDACIEYQKRKRADKQLELGKF